MFKVTPTTPGVPFARKNYLCILNLLSQLNLAYILVYIEIYIWLITLLTMISGFLSPRHGTSSGCEWRNGFQYGG
jgi:hypothetical protein